MGKQQQESMDLLKTRVSSAPAPALSPLDYASGRLVVAIDSSNIAVGWIIFQLDSQDRRRPSRNSSIA